MARLDIYRLVKRYGDFYAVKDVSLSVADGEFLVLLGTFSRYKVAAVFATANIILSAVYILWMYQRVAGGPVRERVAGMADLRPREVLAVAPLIAAIIFVGVYPKPVLDIINPAVRVTMVQVHKPDPVPADPAPGYFTTTAAYTTAVQKGTIP